ncbi:hypothetical protein CI109_106441 [Kwoniella shandongensis]|uniref:Uncharacterized protein n=1 Tax=Kwoniella shandongensis TaxID=1734106 RepID=A0A5M6C156_9TREE|nr:uncharacterized protein CI109_002623 [Kwoniella shandongensis]KAA5528866.1 hypothetical protein CI109_002623 [Kwoniella shandongensis]
MTSSSDTVFDHGQNTTTITTTIPNSVGENSRTPLQQLKGDDRTVSGLMENNGERRERDTTTTPRSEEARTVDIGITTPTSTSQSASSSNPPLRPRAATHIDKSNHRRRVSSSTTTTHAQAPPETRPRPIPSPAGPSKTFSSTSSPPLPSSSSSSLPTPLSPSGLKSRSTSHCPPALRTDSHPNSQPLQSAIPSFQAPTDTRRQVKRLSIDVVADPRRPSYTTSTDAFHNQPITPTHENGHIGITRRRQSISSPRHTTIVATGATAAGRKNSLENKVRPVPIPSALGWLTGNRLALPSVDLKISKSDEEREDEDDDEDRTETPRVAKKHAAGRPKWDWRMTGLHNNGESSSSASSSHTNTPAISMTPAFRDVSLPLETGYYTSPPRAHTSLQPLPHDPHNILPLSLPSTPFGSPPLSRVPTPHHSPHPSLQDLHGEYAASPIGPQPSGSGSSPRTSISTSSSRLGWGASRSDSRSSAEEDDKPSHGPAHHRPTWWTSRGSIDGPISPKISISNTSVGAPRMLRISSSATKLIPTGTRNWRWLIESVSDVLGFGEGKVDLTPRKGMTARQRNRERERLMTGQRGGRKKGENKVMGSKWLARVMLFVPTEPGTISLFLLCLAIFAVTLTATLKHILNPDKEPLPWRQYCTSNYPTLYSLQDPSLPPPHINLHVDPNPTFPHSPFHDSNTIPVNSFAPSTSKQLALKPLTPSHPAWPYHPHSSPPYSAEMATDALNDALDPVGVLIGVFTTDEGVERRHMIRQSYASHWRSRTEGTEGVRIRFVMGRPRRRYEAAVKLEMEAFNDILLLDMDENMNSGKTHAFFSWAAANATVPHWEYPSSWRPSYSPSDPDFRASKDREQSFDAEVTPRPSSEVGRENRPAPIWKGEKRPSYVVKADDDSFIMLGELERRLRIAPRSKAFWGYLVKNQFMAGECYALSFDLVQYIAASPALRTLTKGKEDKLVARWMNMHPEREQIVWMTERCWIYDHPKAGTVYSHGFLFPSAVAEVRSENRTGLSTSTVALRGGSDAAHAYSTVSKFGVAYRPPTNEMTAVEQVEALIEGSPLSKLREEMKHSNSAMGDQTPQQIYSKLENIRQKIDKAFSVRPSRKDRFMGDENERGGTVVVHYIKKQDWFIETMIALLGTADEQSVWHRGVGMGLGALERRKGRIVNTPPSSSSSTSQGSVSSSESEDVGEEGAEESTQDGVRLTKEDGL